MNDEVKRIFEGIDVPEEDIQECGFDKKCFEVYNCIGRMFTPKTVLEIGTRRGYSLVGLCKGNKSIETVLSCDDESYIESSQGVACTNLKKSGYSGEMSFYRMSSHSEEFKNSLKGQKYDYIHIDGDHDKPGVILDLELCLKHLEKGGLMVVDDYNYIIDVKEATDEFVKQHNLGIVVIDSYRGTALVQRRT